MSTASSKCTYKPSAKAQTPNLNQVLSPSSKSSFPRSTLTKTSLSDLRSEENSTELCEEDIDEECEKKSVANFQKNYLVMGQWPEVPVPVFQAFKGKYRVMKQKLKDCKNEREKMEVQLKRYQNGEVPCRNCNELKEKNTKTKAALEQAVQLSNILLKELRKMESRYNSECE